MSLRKDVIGRRDVEVDDEFSTDAKIGQMVTALDWSEAKRIVPKKKKIDSERFASLTRRARVFSRQPPTLRLTQSSSLPEPFAVFQPSRSIRPDASVARGSRFTSRLYSPGASRPPLRSVASLASPRRFSH